MRRPTFPPPGGSGAAAAAASLPSPPAAALLLAAEEAVAPPPGPPFFPPPFPPVSHREARGGRPVFLSRLLTAGLPHRRSPRARGAASPQAARGAHFPPPLPPLPSWRPRAGPRAATLPPSHSRARGGRACTRAAPQPSGAAAGAGGTPLHPPKFGVHRRELHPLPPPQTWRGKGVCSRRPWRCGPVGVSAPRARRRGLRRRLFAGSPRSPRCQPRGRWGSCGAMLRYRRGWASSPKLPNEFQVKRV